MSCFLYNFFVSKANMFLQCFFFFYDYSITTNTTNSSIAEAMVCHNKNELYVREIKNHMHKMSLPES